MKLMVGGARPRGAGYPNGSGTLRILVDQLGVELIECGSWLPDSLHLWKLARGTALAAVARLIRLSLLNFSSVARVLNAQRRERLPVYVPYPSLPFLWFLSFVPRRYRPVCIVDAYISVWDSMYQDRGDGRRAGVLSRSLKRAEARALNIATIVLVDTVANKEYMATEFGLRPDRVRAFPLAIAGAPLIVARQRKPNVDRVVVLFVGTMIPLHGINRLLEGIEPLVGDDRFLFRFVGDGQCADLLQSFLSLHPRSNIEWVREWQDTGAIAEQILQADICLGVFAGTAKASRVLPLKLYMYLAAGKAVISQYDLSWPDGAPSPPIHRVDSNNAPLADAIRLLESQPQLRDEMGKRAAAYYDEWLASCRIAERWKLLLAELG